MIDDWLGVGVHCLWIVGSLWRRCWWMNGAEVDWRWIEMEWRMAQRNRRQLIFWWKRPEACSAGTELEVGGRRDGVSGGARWRTIAADRWQRLTTSVALDRRLSIFLARLVFLVKPSCPQHSHQPPSRNKEVRRFPHTQINQLINQFFFLQKHTSRESIPLCHYALCTTVLTHDATAYMPLSDFFSYTHKSMFYWSGWRLMMEVVSCSASVYCTFALPTH
jgi:hypothetical protein